VSVARKLLLVGVAVQIVLAAAPAQAQRARPGKRVAAPMVGGLATSFLMELLVYPAIYLRWKWNTEVKREAAVAGA